MKMILNERDQREERAIHVAQHMINAARTAPTTRGNDLLEMAIVTAEDIQKLSETMLQFEHKGRTYSFERDSNNIKQAQCVVIIGTSEKAQALNCGHCGFMTCGSKPNELPCMFNSLDIGIAIGSAVAMAAHMRVDTRVMFSAGLAAQKLKLLANCSMIMAIPISISSKNPFFDRITK